MYAQSQVNVAVTSDQTGGNRLTLLARAGELLSSPGAGEQTLERLASMLVTGFAEWCAIDVLREDGAMARVATAPHDGRRSGTTARTAPRS